VNTRVYTCAFAALLSGCSRYADFTLPPPDPSGPKPSFAWQPNADPVISRDGATDILNPSVIRFHNQYLNLYSVYDSKTWHTALAASTDGITWQTRGEILSPQGWEGNYIAANGSAIVAQDEILYWYETGDPLQIALARSQDGAHWTKVPTPVLRPGPRGSFDERAVADPYVIAASRSFYMYYIGLDRAQRQRLGIARSGDGVTWEKLRDNPVLEAGQPGAFDEQGLGEPAVWSSAGSYWMLYTGRSRIDQRRLGLAKSKDGVHWERDESFAPISGNSAWNREVICDPTVEVTPSGIRVWFGGGDVRSPDQNLHGQIGMGLLRPQ
jgi:predicted GH43/DUF377 family glycosyl hydrolase